MNCFVTVKDKTDQNDAFTFDTFTFTYQKEPCICLNEKLQCWDFPVFSAVGETGTSPYSVQEQDVELD